MADIKSKKKKMNDLKTTKEHAFMSIALKREKSVRNLTFL